MISGTVTTKNKFVEDRISSLERRFAELESRLDERCLNDQDDAFADGLLLYGEFIAPDSKAVSQPRGIGAPKKMTDTAFAVMRDRYVAWVEALWPEIEYATSKRGTVSNLRKRVGRRLSFHAHSGDRLFQLLLNHIAELHEYLMSPSNTGDPRRMAYVLAGLSGGLTWRYSIVRGNKHLSALPINFRAMKEHIKRHHPAWYRDLMVEKSRADAIRKIPRGCGECKRFVERPDRIIPALQERSCIV